MDTSIGEEEKRDHYMHCWERGGRLATRRTEWNDEVTQLKFSMDVRITSSQPTLASPPLVTLCRLVHWNPPYSGWKYVSLGFEDLETGLFLILFFFVDSWWWSLYCRIIALAFILASGVLMVILSCALYKYVPSFSRDLAYFALTDFVLSLSPLLSLFL